MGGAAAGIEYNQNIPDKAFPVFCWGHKRLPKQKGQITYTLAPNQHRPGFAFKNHGVFRGTLNTVRRIRGQVLYVAPPMMLAWVAMEWAGKRNRYLNSKAGRAEVEPDS